MKLFSVVLVNLVIVSSAFAQQDHSSFGQVTVTPDIVAIQMKELKPCPFADGTPSSPFPIGMPATEVAGIRIQNNLDHPLTIQYMTLQTDHDVIDISTDDDIKAMFPQATIPAHSFVTSVCGLRVGNINVGESAGPVAIHARLDVLGEAKDSQGLASLFEDKANVTLIWDGKY